MMTEIKIDDPLLKRILYAVGIMGVIAFGFYTFGLLRDSLVVVLNVLTPFIAALLLAYILAPLVIGLQRRLKLGRVMGTLALYMIIFLVFFLLLAFLIPTVISEMIHLFNVIKTSFPAFLDTLARHPFMNLETAWMDALSEKIRQIQVDYEKILSDILPDLKRMAAGGFQAMETATRGLFSGIGSVIGFFSFLVFVGIISFYFIIDWEKIGPTIRKMVPPDHRERVFSILKKMDVAVGGFLRGQLTVSIIVGTLFAFGLFGMGFIGFPALRNYCILIGTVAAIGGFIPYLGPIMGVTPAILIILFTGGMPWSVKIITLMTALGLFAIIQAIEGFILQPKIVGKGAGLHPLVVLLALIAGAQFGIGGMIVAVPIASITQVLIREFYWIPIQRREAESTRPSDFPEAT
jgi:predicted PurR-regulated permease PerM